MELAIALLILVALGFLYYGWLRLRQEAEAKARQLIFRKSHREGEGAVARSHRVTPRSASATELLDAAWAAIDVPEGTESLNWLGATIFTVWYPKQRAWPIWSDESSERYGCAIPTAS